MDAAVHTDVIFCHGASFAPNPPGANQIGFRWQEGTLWFYTYRTETTEATMPESAAICDFPPKKQALLREILERIADKWTLLVIEALDGEGEMRFSDLQRRIGQISHKMLTKTLRQLERDGLVTRRVHAEVPPRVEYKLTELGESLGESVCGVWTWVGQHMPEVERARRAYDRNGKRTNGRIPGATTEL
jgi:DNA-binding HxlR family transcriptional regulator